MKHHKLLFLLISFLLLVSCNQHSESFWPEDKSPEKISRMVIEDLLARPDFMMYHNPQVTSVHYAEVCTAFGATQLAGMWSDTLLLERLADRYMKVITDSIPNTANHVDVNVYGILPLELFKQTGDSVFFRQGISLADGQWKDLRPDGLTKQTRFWIDDVFMIGSLQVQAYRITGNNKYLDNAAKTTIAYLDKLQQSNGLFYHGPDAPFFWGRGNGWMAAGLAEMISELPEDHPMYPEIIEGYKKMMHSLLLFQAEDGMWRQLVDNDSAWEETSCTGMFGYAICMGVSKGILTDPSYLEAYEKAWLALTDYINDEGKIEQVCVGTGQSTDMDYYLNRPTITGDFHGQAPVLWFARCLLQQCD